MPGDYEMKLGSQEATTVRAFIAAWNNKDRSGLRAALHPDITCIGASYPAAQGIEATLALSEPFLQAEEIDWKILNIAQNGGTVFTERRDHFKFADQPAFVVPASGVFEVNRDGLITRWQDYFDTAGLAEAMYGADAAGKLAISAEGI